MSSASSSSALPTHDIIDEILNKKVDIKPDSDLSRFVAQIDVLVAHYEAQLRNKKPIREKLGGLNSATNAFNFADQVSTNVKLIANEDSSANINKGRLRSYIQTPFTWEASS